MRASRKSAIGVLVFSAIRPICDSNNPVNPRAALLLQRNAPKRMTMHRRGAALRLNRKWT
jgi:hypothetical protein